MANLTPMMKQYFDMKKKHPDTILFFRLGDFYEMFHQDAITVSRELDLTLTTRDRNKPEDQRTPMCGMPYHSSEAYIARLITKGYKIAICEQTEDPAKAKGLVERDVVRVVTPGTVMESSMLNEGKNNYLAVIYSPTAKEIAENQGDSMVLALCDISTGSLFLRNITYSDTCITEMCNELGRFSPAEILLSGGAFEQKWLINYLKDKLEASMEEGRGFSEEIGREVYQKQFPKEKIPEKPETLCCFGGLFTYLEETQKTELKYISEFTPLKGGEFLELDLVARRNLELTETLWNREKKGSLLWVLDKTKTPMGGRLLEIWLQRPLLNLSEIKKRQSAVGELKENPLKLSNITDSLKKIKDLERVVAKISYGNGSARELRLLAEGLQEIATLKQEIQPCHSEKLNELVKLLQDLPDLTGLLLRALQEELPLTVREGGMIAAGFHEKVDELRHVMDHGGEMIVDLELKTKEETGIRNLKVRNNRVFGYYIEVAKAQSDAVPEHWVRRQTTVNSERFISEELKELEHSIMTAQEEIQRIEYELYNKLREETLKFTEIIQKTARAVAEIDVLGSLAFVASQQNYVAPDLDESRCLYVEDGRHPVVEVMTKDGSFVSNSTEFNETDHICAIITGPNMAGKSTYMRQVALIVIMAQIGSYIPAKSGKIGLVDQIFTRIGASDDLAGGRSTFMVEMSEVADLLSNASNRSLLILDEIGRGTSTYDGMAMAKAVLEHCRLEIGAKTLFATHYHELSAVEEELSGVKNYNISAKQQGDNILFLRKILPGGADQSYGIQVAKLAGVPQVVIKRAHKILKELEQSQGEVKVFTTNSVELPEEEIDVLTDLKGLDLDELTPRQAWALLSEWKEKLS